jgi:DNA-binding NarL/FixJ family response regulator
MKPYQSVTVDLGTTPIQPYKFRMPQVHVVVRTNHADELNKRHCMAVGASFFFDKSTEFEGLLDAVRAHA